MAEEDEVTGEDEGETGRWKESNIAAQPDSSSPVGHHKGFAQLQHCWMTDFRLSMNLFSIHPALLYLWKRPIFVFCLRNGGRDQINCPKMRKLVKVAEDPEISIIGPGCK